MVQGGKKVNLQNRKVKIAFGLMLAVCVIIGYRIYSNIQADKARAARLSQVRNVAVVTAHPIRQTIVPSLSFSGSLDPEWQAEVAAKVDGRLEKVYVREGDRVSRGQVLAILEQADTDANLLSAKGSFLDAQTSLHKAETDLQRSRWWMITALRVIMLQLSWRLPEAVCGRWSLSLRARC